MAIEYDNRMGSGTVYCDGDKDGCVGEIQIDGTFSEVVQKAKSEGWVVKNDGGQWYHYCQACKFQREIKDEQRS